MIGASSADSWWSAGRMAQHLLSDRCLTPWPRLASTFAAVLGKSRDPDGRKLDLAGQALAIIALGATDLRRDRRPALELAQAPTGFYRGSLIAAVACSLASKAYDRRCAAAARRLAPARARGGHGGCFTDDLRHVWHAVRRAALLPEHARCIGDQRRGSICCRSRSSLSSSRTARGGSATRFGAPRGDDGRHGVARDRVDAAETRSRRRDEPLWSLCSARDRWYRARPRRRPGQLRRGGQRPAGALGHGLGLLNTARMIGATLGGADHGRGLRA